MCRKSVDISPTHGIIQQRPDGQWTERRLTAFRHPNCLIYVICFCKEGHFCASDSCPGETRVLLTYRWGFALVCFSASLRAEQSWTILSSPRACTFVFVRDSSVRLFRGRSHGTRYCARRQRYPTQCKNNAGKVELLLIWRHSKLSAQLRKTQRELCTRPVWRPVRDTCTFLSSDV